MKNGLELGRQVPFIFKMNGIAIEVIDELIKVAIIRIESGDNDLFSYLNYMNNIKKNFQDLKNVR